MPSASFGEFELLPIPVRVYVQENFFDWYGPSADRFIIVTMLAPKAKAEESGRGQILKVLAPYIRSNKGLNFEEIRWGGKKDFFLVGCKDVEAKGSMVKSGRLDRGVYASFAAEGCCLLVFDVVAPGKGIGGISSLLMGVSGVPVQTADKEWTAFLQQAIESAQGDSWFKNSGIVEIAEGDGLQPLITADHTRVVEVIIKKEVLWRWFECADISMMAKKWGINKKGKLMTSLAGGRERTVSIMFYTLPECVVCGLVTPNEEHRPKCPYLNIKTYLLEEKPWLKEKAKKAGVQERSDKTGGATSVGEQSGSGTLRSKRVLLFGGKESQ